MAEDLPEPRTKRKRTAPIMPREPGIPGFPVSMPTCGNDLIGIWSLPMEAVTQARLKICRAIPMSQRVELVRECTVQEYSMESIAMQHGPGEYRLVLNPGPMGAWGGKTSIITVSKEYARECGFDPMPIAPAPAPRLAHLRSMQETTQAMNAGQGMTPAMMVQLVESVVERVVERTRPAAQTVDPMAQMANMWTFLQGMQKSALDQALQLAGVANPVKDEEEGGGWLKVAQEVAPVAASFFAQMLDRKHAAPVPQVPAIPTLAPMEEPVAKIQVNASQDELRPFAGALAMLKPFGPLIVQKLSSVSSGKDAAQELSEYIPERLWDSVIGFSRMVSDRGVSLLSVIHPDIATTKGAECIAHIASILQNEINGGDNA